MADQWFVILGLAIGTYAIRLGGYVLGARLPTSGAWARAFNALPGCLIAALMTVTLAQGGPAEWGAAGLALIIALLTRNLPLTMLTGIVAICSLRAIM
ncbi:AzlD family protein [Roseovarius sp. EL26]|uniref:AzlD family protein n=1 Tax=Roseovarius sp. EL26 TaxID=2126672 RepID=UPI000EA36D1F|nr:AzlD domain-containing protein [Roseovarius sp. EL26]